MTMLPWNWLKMRVSAKKVLCLLTSFRWYLQGMSLKLLDYTSRHCCRNSSKKLDSKVLQSEHKNKKLPSKEQLQIRERRQLGFVTLNGNLAVNLKTTHPPLLNGRGQFTFLKTKSSHSSGIVVYPPKFEFLRN